MRCPRCGCNNRDERETCWRCGFELPSNLNWPDTAENWPIMDPATAGGLLPGARRELAQQQAAPERRSAFWQALFTRRDMITGTVIAVEPVHEERTQRSWRRFALLGLLAMFALALPLIFLSFSVLLAIAVVAMGLLLFKVISPGRIFEAFLLFRFLRPGQFDNRSPVQYLRLRDGQQREYVVRIEGYLRGHIMPGDEVVLEGNFRDGIFEMKEGTNLRTGSQLRVRRR